MPEPTCTQVDMPTWSRRRHFALYEGTPYPFVGVTTELDITDFYHTCRSGKRPFFPAFFHLVMKALNSLVNFRYRIRENTVVEYDRIDASFVVFNREDELFYFAYVDYQDEYDSFAAAVEQAKTTALATKQLSDSNEAGRNLVYVSCLPWFTFTDLIQPLGLNGDDTIPRLMWGRYTERGTRIVLPLSVSAHHGFVDGYHIAQLLGTITRLSEEIPSASE